MSFFFHLANYFQGLSKLQHISRRHSFLWLNDIPPHFVHTFIYLLMDIWIGPTYWLVAIMLLINISEQVLHEHVLNFL